MHAKNSSFIPVSELSSSKIQQLLVPGMEESFQLCKYSLRNGRMLPALGFTHTQIFTMYLKAVKSPLWLVNKIVLCKELSYCHTLFKDMHFFIGV